LTSINEQEHIVYGTFDLAPPRGEEPADDAWELNVGVGRSLTDATPSHWSLKAIVGKAF
jgi:hypothetical protein